MAKKRYYDSMDYSGMIKSSNTEFANMPTQVVFKAYPAGSGYLPEKLDDSIKGIDKQMMKDNAKKMGNLQPEKY